MNINVKYNIGDKIRYFEKDSVPIFKICPCCGGRTYIMGLDSMVYKCPNCEGDGQIYTGETKIEKQEKIGIIKAIHINYDSDSDYYKKRGPEIYYTVSSISSNSYNIEQNDIFEIV